MSTVVDDFTNESLTVEMGFWMNGDQVAQKLDQLDLPILR